MTSSNGAPIPENPCGYHDSLNTQVIIVEGNQDTTTRPLRASLLSLAEYEEDRHAHPTSPRSCPPPVGVSAKAPTLPSELT